MLDRWYPFGKMVPLEARGYLLVVRARRWGAAPLEAGLQKLCEFSSGNNRVSCGAVHLAVLSITSEQSTLGIVHSKAVRHIFDSIENPVNLKSVVAQILCLIARFLVNPPGQCSCRLKICPARNIPAPRHTVPTACSALERAGG